MKVLNLCCSSDHRFEGWFASEDDYRSQAETGLVECPLCADKAVRRLPSAPHVLTSASRAAATAPRAKESRASQASDAAAQSGADLTKSSTSPADPLTLQSAWLRAVQHVIAHTDDVGARFAEEARRMHYGEADERPIRGHATSDEARALHEEGIEVVSLPMPAALKGTVQ